jgi:O-antigen ligase
VVVVAIVLTGSNGGLTALVFATVGGWLFRLVRAGRAPAAVLAACLLACAAVAAASTVDVTGVAARARDSAPVLRDSIGREAESGGSRQTLVREAFSLWLSNDSPVGVGPGGTKAALQAEQAPYVKEAHDDYLAAVVERGLLGGVALVLVGRAGGRAGPADRPAGRAAARVRRGAAATGAARRRRRRRAAVGAVLRSDCTSGTSGRCSG